MPLIMDEGKTESGHLASVTFSTPWGGCSEQNSSDCVQLFSSYMPTGATALLRPRAAYSPSADLTSLA